MFSFIFPIRESCKFQHVPIHKIHKINISHFSLDILKSDLIRCPYKTASLLSHQYFNTLRNLLDKHAQIKMKSIPRHAETGFMNCDSLKAKQLKRKCERAWYCENSASNHSNTMPQSITIIFCLRSPNAIIIPTLWLKTKAILRLCGIVKKRFYTGPLLLFYQITQIKPTLRTLSVSSSMTKFLK